jgi:hypothetical protein
VSTHIRPALDVLAELRRGRTQAELSEALHELMEACKDTGKKGELIVRIIVDPKKVGEFETPRVEISDQITVKRPRRTVMPSTFYLTDDANPVRRDPNQDEFPALREVPADPTTEAKASDTREAN